MAKRKEPHRHTVLRHLSLAADEASKGRAPMALRHLIRAAMVRLLAGKWQGRK